MLEAKRIQELEEKVEKSHEIFEKAFQKFRPADTRLIWSGGKDSTLVLWMCKQYCDKKGVALPPAFTIDEGDAFLEIDEILKTYAQAWNVTLDWGRNENVLKAAHYTLNEDVVVADLNERN